MRFWSYLLFDFKNFIKKMSKRKQDPEPNQDYESVGSRDERAPVPEEAVREFLTKNHWIESKFLVFVVTSMLFDWYLHDLFDCQTFRNIFLILKNIAQQVRERHWWCFQRVGWGEAKVEKIQTNRIKIDQNSSKSQQNRPKCTENAIKNLKIGLWKPYLEIWNRDLKTIN